MSNENELAEEYLAKYSKLMRRILDQSSLLTNYLHEELKTIQLYVDLEKYRLSNEFEFHIRIEEGVDPEVKIPSMILQPFIENAIWHGVTNRKDGKIELIVKKAGAQSIVLEVTDNGAGFDPKKVKNSSKGSSLVQDRLALLNQMEGIKSQLVVNSQFNQGTQIKILVSGITT